MGVPGQREQAKAERMLVGCAATLLIATVAAAVFVGWLIGAAWGG